jgi:hypothetical protein
MEVNMRRFLWATPLLLVLISSGAWANTVSYIFYGPNQGFGDNLAFEQQKAGTILILTGGTPGDFFNSYNGYAPGSTLGGLTTVYFDSAYLQSGGFIYDVVITNTGSLFMSSFTLPTPTNSTSVIWEPVELSFTGSYTYAATGQTVNVGGTWVGTIPFEFGYGGVYYAGGFTAVPEPGAIGLMGTGLIGIFSVARRRLGIFMRL